MARGNSGGGGTGLISLNDISISLNSIASAVSMPSINASTILHGAHGHPNSNRMVTGKSCFWIAGDWSEERRDNDGRAGLMEVGGCYNPSPNFQFGFGIGKSWSKGDLAFNGNIEVDGTHAIADVGVQVPNTPLWFTLTGLYGKSDATIDRGYENAGNLDFSHGNTDLTTRALRGRLDWDQLWYSNQIEVSPYAEYSVIRVHYTNYTETGGGFPARFDGNTETVHDLRIGANATYALNNTTRLLGTIEGVHRFDRKGAGVNGQIIGLFKFNLDGNDYDQDWLRGTAGVERKISNGLLSLTLNATTEGEEAAFWFGAGYRVGFE